MALSKQIRCTPPDHGRCRKVTMRLGWLAIIALVAAGCGRSSGFEPAPGGTPATAGGAAAGASAKGSVKLPAKGCGLLSGATVTALLGGSSPSSSELRPAGVSPPGSVVGCVWRGAGGRQAGIILHQSPGSARDFADNTSGPGFRPVPGLGDKAMLQVTAGQEEGGIWVLKGDIDILIFGTLSGPADGYAATLRQAAATTLTHLGPG
jgi:hypothetical protein